MKRRKENSIFVRNGHGVRIKVCCASCDEKVYDILYHRRCGLTGRKVHPCHSCKQWRMSKNLKNLKLADYDKD
jgi:hypothetical protein